MVAGGVCRLAFVMSMLSSSAEAIDLSRFLYEEIEPMDGVLCITDADCTSYTKDGLYHIFPYKVVSCGRGKVIARFDSESNARSMRVFNSFMGDLATSLIKTQQKSSCPMVVIYTDGDYCDGDSIDAYVRYVSPETTLFGRLRAFRELKRGKTGRPACTTAESNALAERAMDYIDGRNGVMKDQYTGFCLSYESSLLGSRLGSYLTRACFAKGIGVTRNERRYVKWLSRLAPIGDVDDKLEYADCLRDGVGVSADPDKAFAWYDAAVAIDKTNSTAYLNMAKICENSKNEANRKRTRKLYETAGKAGDQDAAKWLINYWNYRRYESAEARERLRYWCDKGRGLGVSSEWIESHTQSSANCPDSVIEIVKQDRPKEDPSTVRRREAEEKSRRRTEILSRLLRNMVLVKEANLYLSRTEVTQAQWELIMGKNPSEKNRGDEYPVESVTWTECQKFIKLLNDHYEVKKSGLTFRLPTSSEWLKVAGEDREKLEEECRTSNYKRFRGIAWSECDDNLYAPRRVATKAPDKRGLYDFYGNVSELCADSDPQRPDEVYVAGGCVSSRADTCLQKPDGCFHGKNQRACYTGLRLAATSEECEVMKKVNDQKARRALRDEMLGRLERRGITPGVSNDGQSVHAVGIAYGPPREAQKLILNARKNAIASLLNLEHDATYEYEYVEGFPRFSRMVKRGIQDVGWCSQLNDGVLNVAVALRWTKKDEESLTAVTRGDFSSLHDVDVRMTIGEYLDKCLDGPFPSSWLKRDCKGDVWVIGVAYLPASGSFEEENLKPLAVTAAMQYFGSTITLSVAKDVESGKDVQTVEVTPVKNSLDWRQMQHRMFSVSQPDNPYRVLVVAIPFAQ